MKLAPVVLAGILGCGADSQPPPLPVGVYPLEGNDPSLPDSDLGPIRSAIGDASLVGLGESVHTSGGYYRAKVRLIEFMVREMGFRALSMETPRTDAMQVGAYVETCQGDPKEALRGIFHVFASEDTLELITWMCQWNAHHPKDRVHFVGFDIQQPWADHADLLNFLPKAAPADAELLSQGIGTCDGSKSTTAKDYYQNEAQTPYAEEAFGACVRGLDAIASYGSAHEGEIAQRTSQEQREWANIALVAFRGWQHERFYDSTDFKRSFAERDIANAYVFEHQRQLLFPEAKTILWAHNGHLQMAPVLSIAGAPGATSMGTRLKEIFGEAYQAIGLIGHNVEINWPGVHGRAPSANSLEVQLHGFGRDYLFVDLDAVSPAFLRPGALYEYGDGLDVPRSNYRALLYLDHSPPMRALFW